MAFSILRLARRQSPVYLGHRRVVRLTSAGADVTASKRRDMQQSFNS